MKKLVRYDVSMGNSPIYGSLGLGVVDHKKALEVTESKEGTWVLSKDIKDLLSKEDNKRITQYNISVENSPVYGSLGMGITGHKKALEVSETKEGAWVRYNDIRELIPRANST
jgi:NOL1/NOP2/fmu family ribosome biogenesis protein